MTKIMDIYLVSRFIIHLNVKTGMFIDLYDCRAETLGISGISILNREDANKALGNIDKASAIISSYRSHAGAQQNRLEHSLSYIGIAAEGTSAAESRIRDADISKEVVELSKQNVLTQAGIALLAQAKQQPEMVLQLLG